MNDTLGACRGEAVKVRLRLHNPVSGAGPNMTEHLSRVERGSLLLLFLCSFRKATRRRKSIQDGGEFPLCLKQDPY